MKSCRGSSELIFVVLNFVTLETRYANDVNNQLKIRGWKNSWVENFVTRGIVTKITKISTPRKLPAIRYIDILIIIINFPYSTCIRSFFGSSSLTSLFIFKWFFRSCKNKNKNKKPKWRFLTSRGTHVNCAIMAMLYSHPIGN